MSIFLGILASVFPNYVQHKVYFRHGKHSAHKVLKYFYVGAFCKYATLIALVVLFLQWPNLHVKHFCAAIIGAECARWIYLLYRLRTTAI